MRKFEQFFREIATLRANTRGTLNTILVKEIIGDSLNNNRTITVTQAFRFLLCTQNTSFARKLVEVDNILRDKFLEMRKKTGRTDAVYLSEFVDIYREEVMDKTNTSLRRKIGTALSKWED